MKSFDVRNKVVFVTGASSGIGRAAAIAFAKAGAKLALASRNEHVLKETAEHINRNNGIAQIVPLDLSQISLIPQAVEKVKKNLGSVDVLINAAAYAVGGLAEDCPIEQYRKNFEVNFYAPLALIQSVLPDMKQKHCGQIINISSGVGWRALPAASAYSATKSALNALTESLRLEVKPFGIDVILVSPGRVASDFHNRIEFYGRHKMKIPEMQMRSPEQLADLILKASHKRWREARVWGPGRIGYHLNYWCPKLVDWLLSKKYPVS